MKNQVLTINSICFLCFLYFFIPIAIEYFTYATITTTFLPHFYPNFPRPKLFLVSDDGPLNISTLNENIIVGGKPANITLVSSNGSRSLYSIDAGFLSANTDHLIGWRKSIKVLYETPRGGPAYEVRYYQLVIKYDRSDDQISVVFKPKRLVHAVSAQIFRRSTPPFGTCRNLNLVSDSSIKCINVRFFKFYILINMSIANVYLANTISMLHEPDTKFPLPFFILLVFGLVGLFSDITAITIDDLIKTIYRIDTSKFVTNLECSIRKFDFNRHHKFLTYAGLCMLCFYHIATITDQYSQYGIQSTMYEGPPLQRAHPITAKMCVYRSYGKKKTLHRTLTYLNISQRIENLANTIIEFNVHDCATKKIYSAYGEGAPLKRVSTCVELVAIDDCSNIPSNVSASISQYTLFFNWLHGVWNRWDAKGIPLTDNKDYITISIYPVPKSHSFSHLSNFYITASEGINQYRMFYFRGQFLKYPYVTKCVNSDQVRTQLNCLEEAYMEYERNSKDWPEDNIGVIMTLSKHGIDMRVTPSMTIFDYISCISTAIGFWLGLCILGSAELFLDVYCTDSRIKTFLTILTWTLLSCFLTYFIKLRFDEYFQYEVSSDMTFSSTPKGILLPSMAFHVKDTRHYRTYPKITIKHGRIASSAMTHCNTFLNRVSPLENMSVVDSIGHVSLVDQSIVKYPTCYVFSRQPILLVDIGKLLGPWNPRNHKYLTIKLWTNNNDEKDSYSIFEMSQESESIVEKHSLDYKRGDFSRDELQLNMRDEDFFAQLKFQIDYLYTKLMKPPYRTQCQDYRDPETYRDSWYYCLMNQTIEDGRISALLTISGHNNLTRWFIGYKSNYMDIHNIAMECIKKANLKPPCESMTSKIMLQSKDPSELPGWMVIEPKTTVKTIFTPKIRPIDFFILLFDQIGFWLGINFLFVCVLCFNVLGRILDFVVDWKKKHRRVTDVNIDHGKQIVVKRKSEMYAVGRLNAMKKWRMLAEKQAEEIREKANESVPENMIRVYSPIDIQELDVSNHEHMISSASTEEILFNKTNRKILYQEGFQSTNPNPVGVVEVTEE